jgi:hypothetical protein
MTEEKVPGSKYVNVLADNIIIIIRRRRRRRRRG